jgi:RimJ/RimL family protein N-acetyltransferase
VDRQEKMLELHPFERSDFDRIVEWADDPRFLMQWAGPVFEHPLDHEQLEKYLAGAGGEKPKRIIWKGVDIATNIVVGHIEIDKIDYGKKYGALSRVLIGIPGLRGRGMGRELVGAALSCAFDDLSLDEVTLAVFDFNHAAIRCYEACGFETFHRKARAIAVEGEKWGVIFMRLTRSGWLKKTSGGPS